MKAFRALFKCCVSRQDDKDENRDEVVFKTQNSRILNEPIIDMKTEHRVSVENEYAKNIIMGENNEIREIDVETYSHPDTHIEILASDNDYLKILFEDRLVRDDEKDFIKYTKKFLIEFIDSLINLENFDLQYNQNKLVLHVRKAGSILTKDLSLGKSIFTLSKKDLKEGVTIEFLAKMMYNTEMRLKWDTSLKVLNKLEGGDDNYVIRSWMHSPMFMVAEREVVDKRTEFYHEGVFYCISTSTPEDYTPLEKDVVRVKTFINALLVSEDKENFYFNSINQMPLPQNIINVTLPMKLLSWYKIFIEAINKSFI